MKANKLLFLLLLSLAASAVAQNSVPQAAREAVQAYFSAYRVAGYAPASAMRADSMRTDETARTFDVFANEAFCAQPLTPAVVRGILRDLSRRLPPPYNTFRLTVYGRGGQNIEEMIPNLYREGTADADRLWGDVRFSGNAWVRNLSRPYTIERGLDGRHLAVAPSHGRYYKQGAWRWQRPYLFCTNEDLFTQSFVYPFLIPMLEHAGAVVYCPRERDVQTAEAIVDNDAPESMGEYTETDAPDMAWHTVGDSSGFAPPRGLLTDSMMPFRAGTSRMVTATTRRTQLAQAVWSPRLPRAGRYAVYVSYASRPNSVSDARYTVYHKGGRTQFRINQQIGGGTWVYLGTFDFEAGTSADARVVLSNRSDYRGVVTADGVRFGGGVGQTERGLAGTSGLPRFLEGARYHAQWCGVPDSLRLTGDGNNDYNDDIRVRPNSVNYIGGGSPYLPGLPGLRVPLELYLAVHSDAGVRRDNAVYGSLAICTTHDAQGNARYPAGISRQASADLADVLLTTVCRDLTASVGRPWTRRELWDRNYGEARIAGVPSAILEMLSHQNFNDLKYGHDPNFKFDMARAIYKALLRFVCFEHSANDFVVQPLPVRRFAALLTPDGTAVRLSWQPTNDPLEPTALPTAYVVYTKTDDEAFDNGRKVNGTSLTLPVSAGKLYSFKVTAINDGGESFPSEELAVYSAPEERRRLLIVNGFNRLSGPARVEAPDSLGFDLRADIGVPYRRSDAFAGAQINFDASAAGGEGPQALGFCGSELVGTPVIGNTFDYPELHGRAIRAAAGYSFCSAGRDALTAGDVELRPYAAIDYICGLERDAPHNLRPYKAMPDSVRQVLAAYLENGGRLFVSGAYIGADLQTTDAERDFAADVLKFRWGGTDIYDAATAQTEAYVSGLNLRIPLCREYGRDSYAAITTDVLLPASAEAFPAFAYPSGRSAGIAYRGSRCRIVATGFPFECISDAEVRRQSMRAILQFLTE